MNRPHEWIWNDRIKRRQQEKRAERVENGLCYLCGNNAPIEGAKKCQACRNKAKAAYIKYNENNPQKRKGWRDEHRRLVLEHYGLACACCGEDDYGFLTIDHINNDGAKHRREIGRGNTMRWLVVNSFPPGFQTLCYNCNLGRARNSGICPHKTAELTLAVAA